jgi:hypothetical protein
MWTEVQCWNCGGHGQVSAYSADGSDFLGPDECKTCNGRFALVLTGRPNLVPRRRRCSPGSNRPAGEDDGMTWLRLATSSLARFGAANAMNE